MSKETHLEKAMEWVSKRKTLSVRSRFGEGELEPTQFFHSKSTETKIQPDISFVSPNGAKSYTEIALKTEDARDKVTRWKLLSLLATSRKGKLFLLTPKGHKMFTQKLVEDHKIVATIYSI